MKILKILTIMFLIFFGSQSNLSAMRNPADELLFNIAQNAVLNGYIDIIEGFLRINFNFNQTNNNGWTLLTLAILNGHTDIVQLLLEKGVNPNQINDAGSTPLMIAAKNGHTDIVHILLNRGVDPNQPGYNGNTSLMIAAQDGHINVVQLLLDRDANPNQQNDDGNTPLIVGMNKNHANIIRLLLQKGADPNQTNKFGRTATLRTGWHKRLERNETLSSWYLKNSPYSMSFLNLFESKELADTNLPHGLKAHRAILTARLEKWTTTKLEETLELMNKEEAEAFLFWIYTGMTQEAGQKELIAKTCRDLNIDYLAKTGPVGFINDMQRLYNRKEYTYNKEAGNFTVVLGKRKIVEYKAIPAQKRHPHKAILVARSDFFRGMFLFQSPEDNSNQVRDRSGLSLIAFNALMEFIYTSKITNLTQEISNELLEEMAALFFQLPEGELEEYLEQVI